MEYKLVWVGPRESDILFGKLDFFRSITFNGSDESGNIAFTSKTKTRINHNNTSSWNLMHFLRKQTNQLLDDPCVRFMFYNPMQSYSLGINVVERTLCNNSQDLLAFLRNKSNVREFAQNTIPVVPYVQFEGGNLPELSFNIGEKDTYILQKARSSGGYGTLKMSRKACIQYIQQGTESEQYIISPFLKNAAPLNVHLVIFSDKCIVLPPSFQIIYHDGTNYAYIGGDFNTNLSEKEYDLIIERTTMLAEELRKVGYRGVCGFDYMITQDELYFLEMNPRFQASSFLVDKLLAKEGKPTLHELNYQAFLGESAPIESFRRFESPESYYTVSERTSYFWFSNSNDCMPRIVNELLLDGFSQSMNVDSEAYLFRIIVNRNLCWLNQDYQLNIAPNILPDNPSWQENVCKLQPLAIKIGLLNQGVCFTREAIAQLENTGNAIRQGVFQSIDLFLSTGLIINAPYHTDFSELSPYCIDFVDDNFVLNYNRHKLCTITFDAVDPYRDYVASGGTLYRNVTFWATDRLRVHHQFRCHFKADGVGCRFCNVRPKEGAFSVSDVCEVIDFYLEHANFRHFLIGGGSGSDSSEFENIRHITQHIRSRCEKPIYVMCLPPNDISVLKEYHAAGISEIGFNLELYDRDLARKVMPGKGNIPLLRYENAYREAVRLWGRDGNVRSLMVLGLEKLESFYCGIDWLCQLGVMPIISVFRPLNNIQLDDVLPPGNETLAQIYDRVSDIAAKYNLVPGPHCIACQNNTLSLPFQ